MVRVDRNRLRSGTLRLRSAWLPILQTALAACVAWFLAVLLLGMDRPTFAPIAAVIALGLAVGERTRRAVEPTLAVAFGVAMADLLLSVVGVGRCRPVSSWCWRWPSAVDIIGGTGMDRAEALHALQEASGRASW